VLAFRRVALPAGLSGTLSLHSMPGCFEPWDRFVDAAREGAVSVIVCLAEEHELRVKSPAYARAVLEGTMPFPRWDVPFPNFGVTADRERFASVVGDAARTIRGGGHLLAHCAYGIGRTGTFARCVLHALGLSDVDAAERVKAAGSGPETSAQSELVTWHASRSRD
jgi:protein-tyrosine phosphatase